MPRRKGLWHLYPVLLMTDTRDGCRYPTTGAHKPDKNLPAVSRLISSLAVPVPTLSNGQDRF